MKDTIKRVRDVVKDEEKAVVLDLFKSHCDLFKLSN